MTRQSGTTPAVGVEDWLLDTGATPTRALLKDAKATRRAYNQWAHTRLKGLPAVVRERAFAGRDGRTVAAFRARVATLALAHGLGG